MGMGHLFRARALPSFALVASGLALSLPLAIGVEETATAQDKSTDLTKPATVASPTHESPGFAVLSNIRAARMDLLNADTHNAAAHLQSALDLLNLSLKKAEAESPAPADEIWVRVSGQVLVGNARTKEEPGAPDGINPVTNVNSRTQPAAPESPAPVNLVTFTEILLPVNGTLSRVLQARALMAQNKFYEANGLLSRIEADLQVRSTSLTTNDLGTPLDRQGE